MVVTLPLPATINQYFPSALVSGLQWFAFYTFAALLIVPWLLCIYRLATTSLGRTKKIKYILNEATAPKIVIVMPVYKEEPDVLLTAINSVVECEYPASCIHVFLSFDGDQVDELYLKTVDRLGIPITMKDIPMSIDVAYNGARVTVSRFPHGGKRKCQKATFKLIDKIYSKYAQYNDDLFILFIDSDCILDKVCIQNFLYDMELKPGSKKNMVAMTGVITSTTEKQSLLTLIQDMEYVHGQLFERSVEAACGAVTCLPGALTILRFSAFRDMAKYYFADKAEQCDDFFDYGKCHLGEDRWLTHLFMIATTERYQIQMCANAFCKTEAVQTFRSLLKQRRRWFLGFITNEVCMLTDLRLWRQYPALCMVRFMSNTIRTTALLFFIMVISICTTSNKVKNLPVGFLAVSLGLNYLLMLYFGAKMRRFKAWLYPLMFIVNPFFNWLYLVYGIFTAGQRTWGGPRADAGKADAKTSPQQAIENAKATGDDLNIVPETFRAATEARRKQFIRRRPTTLQPSESVEGRFGLSNRRSGRWTSQAERSGLPLPATMLHERADSISSIELTDSLDFALETPRLVQSFSEELGAKGQYDGAGSLSSSEMSGQNGGSRSRRVLQTHAGIGRQAFSTTQFRLDRSEQERIRSSSAAQSAPQYFEADPGELNSRLERLAIPRPTYDGIGSLRQDRSPLGRISPVSNANEAEPETHNMEERTVRESRMEESSRRSRGRRASSERRKLHKRQPSPVSIV